MTEAIEKPKIEKTIKVRVEKRENGKSKVIFPSGIRLVRLGPDKGKLSGVTVVDEDDNNRELVCVKEIRIPGRNEFYLTFHGEPDADYVEEVELTDADAPPSLASQDTDVTALNAGGAPGTETAVAETLSGGAPLVGDGSTTTESVIAQLPEVKVGGIEGLVEVDDDEASADKSVEFPHEPTDPGMPRPAAPPPLPAAETPARSAQIPVDMGATVIGVPQGITGAAATTPAAAETAPKAPLPIPRVVISTGVVPPPLPPSAATPASAAPAESAPAVAAEAPLEETPNAELANLPYTINLKFIITEIEGGKLGCILPREVASALPADHKLVTITIHKDTGRVEIELEGGVVYTSKKAAQDIPKAGKGAYPIVAFEKTVTPATKKEGATTGSVDTPNVSPAAAQATESTRLDNATSPTPTAAEEIDQEPDTITVALKLRFKNFELKGIVFLNAEVHSSIPTAKILKNRNRIKLVLADGVTEYVSDKPYTDFLNERGEVMLTFTKVKLAVAPPAPQVTPPQPGQPSEGATTEGGPSPASASSPQQPPDVADTWWATNTSPPQGAPPEEETVIRASGVSVTEKVRIAARKNPKGALAAGALAVALAAGTAISLLPDGDDSKGTDENPSQTGEVTTSPKPGPSKSEPKETAPEKPEEIRVLCEVIGSKEAPRVGCMVKTHGGIISVDSFRMLDPINTETRAGGNISVLFDGKTFEGPVTWPVNAIMDNTEEFKLKRKK